MARSWTFCITAGTANSTLKRTAGTCNAACSTISKTSGKEPDHGIWEVRGDQQHFTNSKVMAWVAFDRAVKTVEHFKLDGPVDRWRELRDTIHDDVCRFGFDPALGAFVQSYGSKQFDASALLIPLVGFLPPQDPRVRSTVDAVSSGTLSSTVWCGATTARPGSTACRRGRACFSPAAFGSLTTWCCSAAAREARSLFERLLSLRNDVGLLSEEYDVKRKRLVGNFPQALSHVALINTGHLLGNQAKHRRHLAGRIDEETKEEAEKSPLT